MTFTISIKREVALSEPFDVLIGAGGLSFPWWGDVMIYQGGHLVEDLTERFEPKEGDEVHLTHWDRDSEGETTGKTIFSWGDIVAAYQRAIDSGNFGDVDDDPFDLIQGAQDELGLVDAIGADVILQYVCYGEVIFG